MFFKLSYFFLPSARGWRWVMGEGEGGGYGRGVPGVMSCDIRELPQPAARPQVLVSNTVMFVSSVSFHLTSFSLIQDFIFLYRRLEK